MSSPVTVPEPGGKLIETPATTEESRDRSVSDDSPIAKTEETSESSGFSLRVFRYGGAADYTLITVSAIANLGAGVLLPLFMSLFGDMVNTVGSPGSGRSLNWYVVAQLIMGGICFVLSWIGATCIELAAERQKRAIRSGFVRAITRQEIGWFDRFDGGELSSKLNESVKVIRDGIGLKLGQVFMFAGMFVGGYAVGIYRGWKLALVITATLPVIAGCGALMMKFMAEAGAGARKAYASAGSIAEEAFSTIRSIAAFGLENRMIQEYITGLNESFNFGRKEALSVGFGLGAMMASMFLTYALGFWYGSKLIADDLEEHGAAACYLDDKVECYSGGTVMAVFFCVIIGAFAVGQAGPNISALGKASGAIGDIEKLTSRVSLINSETEEGLKAAPNGSERIEGNIEFRNVKFAYPTRTEKPIFGNLNLTIPAGKSVALVGGSGCGKSTIIQLVERFYDPDGGQILVDGRDLRDYNPKWIRGQMALVSQEPKLFAASIRENIKAGRIGCGKDTTNDQLVQAAKNANAHNFIMDFPKKYDTYVGEGGGQLSGGQKQRVAIARAIVRDPAILILDEATSALDNESEKIVQETLDQIVEKQKRTTIIIAHRLTTVRKADVIVVLDNPDNAGAVVVEQGTHDELMAIPDGLYYNLVRNQQDPSVRNVEDRQFAEVAANFQGDIPKRELSGLKLRSRFSRVSRNSLDGSRSRISGTASIVSKTQDPDAAKSSKMCAKDPNRVKWRQVVKLLKPWWIHVTLGCIAATINGCLWPVFSICMSEFVGVFFKMEPDDVRSGASFWSIIFVVFACVVGVSMLGQQFLFGYAGTRLTRELREQTFSNIMYQDMEFFDSPEHATGNLSEILSGDVVQVKGWVGENLGIYLQNAVALIAGVIISFTASAKLAGVCLGACCLLAPAIMLETKFFAEGGMSEESKARGEGKESAGFIINETIVNMRTVAAYSLEDHMCGRYDAVVDREYSAGKKKSYVAGFAWGLTQFAQYAVQALCLWYGGRLVEKREIDVQTMMRAIFALMMAAMGMGQTMIFTVDNATAQKAANRVWYVRDRKPKIDARSLEGRAIGGLKEELNFEKVNFRYPQRPDVPIYNDLSFCLKHGEVVALVGPSGCGKSTAVQLIERFYDVSDDYALEIGGDANSPRAPGGGRITIDGIDIRDINVRSLRGKIGLVNQEPVLFSNSIADNIAVGKEGGASLAEVEEACKMANAHNFISEFPDGYETNVGKMGGKLSGGQKQRIAIARALIRNPSLLILDEATSALDSESEKIVQAALDNLLEQHKRSTIVIAHRLSTVRNADKIVVLVNEEQEGSKVVEVGTHQQLMAIEGGVYRGLVMIAEGGRPQSSSK